MSDAQARRLAREIAHLRRDMDALMRSSQLGHSSIEGGALKVYDESGTLRHIIGEQADGTYTYTERNGPAPEVIPSQPKVFRTESAVWVYWDGKTADGSLLPMDLEGVEVYLDDDSGVETDLDWRRGVMASPYAGAQFLPIISGVQTGEVWAGLRFLTRSGQRSPMSQVSEGTYHYINNEVPSAPIVSRGNSGEIYVSWDGFADTGSQPGPEQTWVQVHVDDDSVVSPGLPWGKIPVREGRGTAVIAPGLLSASFQYFALAFENATGGVGPMSVHTQA